MAPNRPKSPKERRDAKNARSFIGRQSSRINFNKAGEENLAMFFEKDTVKFAGLKLV
jgi:hypothetical protein